MRFVNLHMGQTRQGVAIVTVDVWWLDTTVALQNFLRHDLCVVVRMCVCHILEKYQKKSLKFFRKGYHIFHTFLWISNNQTRDHIGQFHIRWIIYRFWIG